MKMLTMLLTLVAAAPAYAECLSYSYPATAYLNFKGVVSAVEFEQRDIGSLVHIRFDSVTLADAPATCIQLDLSSSNADIAKLQMLHKQALMSFSLGYLVEGQTDF